MSVPPAYTEPIRLAITPKIDGKLDPEEWDLLSTGPCESYMEWEPGKIHVAAKLPIGQDAVISLDTKGDGWLQGADNIEVRVKWVGAAAELAVRRLDASLAAGPQWVDAGDLKAAAKVAGSVDGSNWIAEVTLADAGTRQLPSEAMTSCGVRVDAVPATETLEQPFLPRVMGMVRLQMDRGTNIPAGLQWKPEFKGRSVIPGEGIRIRMTFNGNDELGLKRVDLRTEGLAKDDTASRGFPFPTFDRKNRAFVDYETDIKAEAPGGWRVLRGTLTDAAGKVTLLQTSYEVAPPVSFDFEVPKKIASSADAQTLRLGAYIRSNTKKRVNGIFHIEPPQGWKVMSGNDKPFVIYNARGSKRQVFEISVPGGFKGAVPLKFVGEVGVQSIETVVWLYIP